MTPENITSSLGTKCDSAAYDVGCAVVGGGVVGLAIGMSLAERSCDVIVLEQHSKTGTEVSSRNSEVIHAGLYYPANSLRARFCVEGRKKLLAFCESTGVPVRQTGKLLVATSPEELGKLEAIAASAKRNGTVPLSHLSAREAQDLEPHVHCVGALLSPGTAVLDSHQLLIALEGRLAQAGGTLALNTRVTGLKRLAQGGFAITCQSGGDVTHLTARTLVIAGGLGATTLGDMLTYDGAYRPPRTYPAKGHYFALRGRAPFSHLIYPVPHGAWLGVHLTLNVAGQARFGPDIEWRNDVTYDFDDADGARQAKFEREVRRYWPGLPTDALVPDTTGVRPKIYAEGEPAADFAIHDNAEHGVPGLIALYGIESPGLTSSLAIGAHVADLLNGEAG